MKELLEHLNKAFESKARLGIMSALMVNDRLDFNALKELLDLTDGNLASHLKALEEGQYVEVQKAVRGPQTQHHLPGHRRRPQGLRRTPESPRKTDQWIPLNFFACQL
jgi:DNA-binding transcriptional ArsR family regulator